MEIGSTTKRTVVQKTKINFQRHDEKSIYRLVTQSKMIQTKITRYYQPVNCEKRKHGNEKKATSWSDSSVEDEGIV